MRFYKIQINTFYGKGGGLNFVDFSGPRLGLLNLFHVCVLLKHDTLIGTLLQKQIDTKGVNCTVKKQRSPPWGCCTCKDTLDQDYTAAGFWYTVEWKGAIGTWISIPMPR